MWGSLIPMKIWSSTMHPASTEGLRVGGVVGRSYWDTCSVSSPTLSGWKLQIYKKNVWQEKPNLHNYLICSTMQVHCRWSLRSAAQSELFVVCSQTAIRQRRAFSMAGPMTWNELPTMLRQIPNSHSASLLTTVKTVLFERGWVGDAPT